MNIFRKSLVMKLWLAMVILVIIVLWVAGFTHINIIERTYYNQQAEQLRVQGERVAEVIAQNPDPATEINILSRTLGINITQVNEDGIMERCHGLGKNIRRNANTGYGMRLHGHRNMLWSPEEPAGTPARNKWTMHHNMLWSPEGIQRVLEGETLYYRGPNRFLNNDVLSVALPVWSGDNVEGAVIVSAPLAPIAGRVQVLQKVSLFTGIGGIVLATLLSLLFSRKLSRPLIQMNKVAQAMAAGDFSKQVDIKGNDEVGLLGSSLNNLSRQLQDKISAIERMDQTRRDFVANVSHELRTPLSIIQGYTEALADGMAATEEERREYLDIVQEEVLRLRRLVNDLLDLRKMETGQTEMKFSFVELSSLLGRVTEHFRGPAKKKNINLILRVEPDLPPVMADEDRLKQVFINLLDNGLRAVPDGGMVKVSAVQSNGEIKISIKDSGPGIPEEEIPLIWERFYKVDKSRARESGGTGLGLAISRRIVEAHGGKIDVHCPEEGGTEFYIHLPVNDIH